MKDPLTRPRVGGECVPRPCPDHFSDVQPGGGGGGRGLWNSYPRACALLVISRRRRVPPMQYAPLVGHLPSPRSPPIPRRGAEPAPSIPPRSVRRARFSRPFLAMDHAGLSVRQPEGHRGAPPRGLAGEPKADAVYLAAGRSAGAPSPDRESPTAECAGVGGPRYNPLHVGPCIGDPGGGRRLPRGAPPNRPADPHVRRAGEGCLSRRAPEWVLRITSRIPWSDCGD